MHAETARRYVPSHRRTAESGPDFYPTPRWATWLLLKHELIEGNVWEPACGEGDMAEVFKEAGFDVYASDLYDRGYGETGIDFTDLEQVNVPDVRRDNIITNPPFALAEEFWENAHRIAKRKVCLLLRTAFVESSRRYRKIFEITPPVRIWAFSERLSMYPKGYDVKGGGTTSYSWFVWEPYNPLRTTKLKWFPPGYKPKGRGNAR